MATVAAEAPAPAKGKKKLIVIIAAAALLLGGGGVATVLVLKKKPVDAEGEDHAPAAAAHVKFDPKAVPIFVPLDPFTVNLADRDAERYAQVGITLEIENAQVGEQIKVFMPAIRNHILMAIADRNAGELLGREGKALLAEKVRKEASRALGADVEDDEDEADADNAPKPAAAAKKRKKKRTPPPLPVKAVHFSNFIIQ